jgi:hypothetical protein
MVAPPSSYNTKPHKNLSCRYCSKYGKASQRCVGCWRKWAWHKYRKACQWLQKVTTPGVQWHHVVVHCRMRPNRDTRKTVLTSLLNSLKYRYNKYGKIHYTWVWHSEDDGAHCHLLIGAQEKIDKKWLFGRWTRIQKKYLKVEYARRDAFCKLRDSPKLVMGYMLGLGKKPREHAPWGGMRGRVTDNNLPSVPRTTRQTRQRPDDGGDGEQPVVQPTGPSPPPPSGLSANTGPNFGDGGPDRQALATIEYRPQNTSHQPDRHVVQVPTENVLVLGTMFTHSIGSKRVHLQERAARGPPQRPTPSAIS